MILKKYLVIITLRIVLIIITCYLFTFIIQRVNNEYYYTATGLGLLIVFQGYLLVVYMNKINRDLALFFNAVQNEDSSLLFPAVTSNKSYSELQNSLNMITKTIAEIKTDNEKKSLYLKNVINHVDVGLLAFAQDGKIEFFNEASTILLNIHRMKNIAEIGKINKELLNIIQHINPGETRVIKILIQNSHYDLSVKANLYKIEGQEVKLVSLQNIKNELERQELESWQKLIRVLNHEIMNSLSPIISLTKTLNNYFKNSDNTVKSIQEINYPMIQKTVDGLSTIEETGEGLIEFINNYRSITSIPGPNLKKIGVNELFRNILILLGEQLSLEKINVTTKIYPAGMQIVADINQISQVIINLFFNSIEALKNTKDGTINIKGEEDIDGSKIIEVTDNGPGIPSEIIDEVFIPFFSTKENGSGIGLSLARQIMRLHNGTIRVSSRPGDTRFTLKFSS